MAKRGRTPALDPTPADRAKVRELLRKKSPISDLAKLFECSTPTFRKHFAAEVAEARKPAQARSARSARKVTETQREKVRRYVGCKMPLQQIAFAVGYEAETDFDYFKADFARDIDIGAAVFRAAVLDQLHAQMVGGTIGATNKLLALSETEGAGHAKPADAKPSGYVSKKETALAAAAGASATGNKFAPRQPPQLKVVGGCNDGN